jgi:hypothetical protein
MEGEIRVEGDSVGMRAINAEGAYNRAPMWRGRLWRPCIGRDPAKPTRLIGNLRRGLK